MQIAKAMKKIHDRKNIGKIILSPMKEPQTEPEAEPQAAPEPEPENAAAEVRSL